MSPTLSWSGLATALFLVTAPVGAHHSTRTFDYERDITLEGRVTKYKLANPHGYIEVETATDAGEREVWIVEGPQLSAMRLLGWSKNSLTVGDRVIVSAHPSRNSMRQIVLGKAVQKENGTLLTLRVQSSNPLFGGVEAAARVAENIPVPFASDNLSGQWITRWNPDGRLVQRRSLWPLTEKGIIAVESFDNSVNPALNCVPLPVPQIMVWPSLKSIEIGESVIMISYADGGEHIVHMDANSHGGASYTNQGHSFGWWEDDVLVVDTAYFSDHRNGHGMGLASGQQKHLVEHFELGSDGTELSYTFWIEDPEYLDEAVTGKLELLYRPDLSITNEPCDPEQRRYLDE